MRILIYGLNYSPELVGIGKFSGEMAEWLAARGCEVRVISAPPYYPAWRVGQGYQARRYSAEKINGVHVERCPLWIPAKPTGLRRVLHLASFALTSFPLVVWRALTWRPDVVLTVAPAFFCAPGGWLAARLGGATAWLHVQDLELDAAFDLGLLSAPMARGAASAVERCVLRRFDRVSTISRQMANQIRNKGVALRRLDLLPNWVDTSKIFPAHEAARIRNEFGVQPGRVVALYSGNMGEKQGLDVLISAAKSIAARAPVDFILCGDGAARASLEKLASGLGNVRFLPLQPADRLNDLLNLADVHLLPQKEGVADLVMPSKLTSILSCGGAVIATANPWTEVGRAVREAGGCIVPPGDADSLAAEITRLAEDSDARRTMGERAREYALTHLDKSMILGDLLSRLQTLQHRSPAQSIETEAHLFQ